jgi:hypothetical protein
MWKGNSALRSARMPGEGSDGCQRAVVHEHDCHDIHAGFRSMSMQRIQAQACSDSLHPCRQGESVGTMHPPSTRRRTGQAATRPMRRRSRFGSCPRLRCAIKRAARSGGDIERRHTGCHRPPCLRTACRPHASDRTIPRGSECRQITRGAGFGSCPCTTTERNEDAVHLKLRFPRASASPCA